MTGASNHANAYLDAAGLTTLRLEEREAHPHIDELAQAVLFESQAKFDRMQAFLDRKKPQQAEPNQAAAHPIPPAQAPQDQHQEQK